MGDLEMVKRCAEAMGITVKRHGDGWCYETWGGTDFNGAVYVDVPYAPLTDDAQAMALVKKFSLIIWWWCEGVQVMGRGPEDYRTSHADDHTIYKWLKSSPCQYYNCDDKGIHIDLNRAIVECVARLKERA